MLCGKRKKLNRTALPARLVSVKASISPHMAQQSRIVYSEMRKAGFSMSLPMVSLKRLSLMLRTASLD
jgi:hypothetical protein